MCPYGRKQWKLHVRVIKVWHFAYISSNNMKNHMENQNDHPLAYCFVAVLFYHVHVELQIKLFLKVALSIVIKNNLTVWRYSFSFYRIYCISLIKNISGQHFRVTCNLSMKCLYFDTYINVLHLDILNCYLNLSNIKFCLFFIFGKLSSFTILPKKPYWCCF